MITKTNLATKNCSTSSNCMSFCVASVTIWFSFVFLLAPLREDSGTSKVGFWGAVFTFLVSIAKTCPPWLFCSVGTIVC